jgi:hypothetical protein
MRPLAAAAILSFWATTGTAQEVPVSAVGILDLQSAMLAEPNTLGQDQDRRSREEGFARFAFALGPTYSRVEGLPIRLGALGESAGDNPVRAQAYLIIRTEADNSERLDRVGFTGRIEKFFGGKQAFLVGVEGSSAIQWIETSGVSNLENGLGTFIFHDDFRDYFERKGASVYGRYGPRESPFRVVLAFGWDHFDAVPPGGTTSLIKNNDAWRAQSLVGVGGLLSAAALVRYDSRTRTGADPATGWFATGLVVQGLGGTLESPTVEASPANGVTAGLPEPERLFTTGKLDVRRYTTIGNANLRVRGVAGGVITNDPLAPQFQHALGGMGTLPGFDLFQLDCGARSFLLTRDDILGAEFYPSYGCDRYVLFQAELQGYLGLQLGEQGRVINAGPLGLLELAPRWAVFFDAGRPWALDSPGPLTREDEDAAYDAGIGVLLGDFGVFAAYPLNRVNQDLSFFEKFNISLRLGSRF